MVKKIHVAAGPLTGTIYAGTLSKDGRTWSANKQDVTDDALLAVADHVLRHGGMCTLTITDGTRVKLTAQVIE
jgi:hypothetical protein